MGFRREVRLVVRLVVRRLPDERRRPVRVVRRRRATRDLIAIGSP